LALFICKSTLADSFSVRELSPKKNDIYFDT
jgi:hypothetical protein